MNILVTGYKGFVGQNLIYYLKKNKKVKILTFGKENNIEDLNFLINKSDIIFHLAGENRNKNEREFVKNNLNLTKYIVSIIKKKDKKNILIFSSTSQILKKKNIYSKTKLLTENFLKQNINKFFSVKIYRFTNLFGKWAKPNFNSVIATFSHLISRNKKIKLSKVNENIEFLHIDRVIELFEKDIKKKPIKKFELINKFDKTYKIKLHDLAKKINYFHLNRKNLLCEKELAYGFDKLLYSTYLSYIPTSQYKYLISSKNDKRGSFYEFIKSSKNGQISILVVKPNQVRGNHYHMTKVEKFFILTGNGEFIFENLITKIQKKIKVNSSQKTIVETIPGWVHNIKNTGKKDLIFILWSNEIYNQNKPDTVYSEIN